jgi:hypothetical protein
MKTIDYSARPGDSECSACHRDYVNKVSDGNIVETLRRQKPEIERFIRSIPSTDLERVHAPYTWSVRTVIGHCIEGERVYGYRLMRAASGDGIAMPGWDENFYARCGMTRPAPQEKLADEFVALREANVLFIERLAPEAWMRIGEANNTRFSVRTQVWLMAAHWIHHVDILRKRLGMSS